MTSRGSNKNSAVQFEFVRCSFAVVAKFSCGKSERALKPWRVKGSIRAEMKSDNEP